MKISTLIKILQKKQAKYGDIVVEVNDSEDMDFFPAKAKDIHLAIGDYSNKKVLRLSWSEGKIE